MPKMTSQEWNRLHPVGIGVYLVEDDGSVTVTKTRSIAWDLGCGEPVVKVDGKRGGYLLSRITVR